jgi:hypothetical protein
MAIRLPLDWFPLTYQLDFDVRLRATYPNNAEPDRMFEGFTRIRIRCHRSTDELRLHMKQLRLMYITLKQLDSTKNLINEWKQIDSSEMIICRLRKRCIKDTEYLLEARYSTELDLDMAGFYLSRYNVTDPLSGTTVTHNIGATHMQVDIVQLN